MIYFTSDLHFGHKREFLFIPRGYDSIEEHDSKIVENWNSIITENDDVFILGDLMLNDNENGLKLLSNLNGKLHIIRGNHDSEVRMNLYSKLPNVVEICEGKFLNYNNFHFFLSHYPCIVGNYDKDKPLRCRMISLCGHSHTSDRFQDMDKGLIYHCELDAHDNFPVSIENIITEIKEFLGK